MKKDEIGYALLFYAGYLAVSYYFWYVLATCETF